MYKAIKTASESEFNAIAAYLTAAGNKSPLVYRAGRSVIWMDEYKNKWDTAGNGSRVGGDALSFSNYLRAYGHDLFPKPIEVRVNAEYVAVIHPTHVQVGCQRVEFSSIRELASKLPA